ncbi:hypothetical protein [Kiloniella sp.]|uniref:hypothetical protein n=1 Tax=Kiloniella sp. TaxID=1938587 RepID=UPI003A959746
MIEASRIMGCSYAHVDVFVKAGMLVRHNNGAGAEHLSAEEIRAFVAPIGKLEAIGNNADLVPITKIYSHCQRRICETYSCFLDGKLQRAYSNPDVNGLSGLMVDATEVLNALSGGVECEHTRLCEVMTAQHTDARTLRRLAGQNILRLFKEQHPRTRFMRTYVDKHTLEKFNESYITLGCLAKIAQTTTTGLSSRLDAAWIKPVFPMGVKNRVYLKNDVKDYYKPNCE